MNMPGFSAEASLYRRSEQHWFSAVHGSYRARAESGHRFSVAPAQNYEYKGRFDNLDLGADPYGWFCGRMARCCLLGIQSCCDLWYSECTHY
jgi:hypothetical protein